MPKNKSNAGVIQGIVLIGIIVSGGLFGFIYDLVRNYLNPPSIKSIPSNILLGNLGQAFGILIVASFLVPIVVKQVPAADTESLSSWITVILSLAVVEIKLRRHDIYISSQAFWQQQKFQAQSVLPVNKNQSTVLSNNHHQERVKQYYESKEAILVDRSTDAWRVKGIILVLVFTLLALGYFWLQRQGLATNLELFKTFIQG